MTVHAAWVIGGSGYVGAEFLRLIADHPQLELEAAFSRTEAGQPIDAVFPHLTGAHPRVAFHSLDEWSSFVERDRPLAIFGAAPHGAAAALLSEMLARLESAGRPTRVLDTSADFRLRDLQRYESTYGVPHGAPDRVEQFFSALPDLPRSPAGERHIAHPGCFTTATTLATTPLVASGFVRTPITVSAVTGSTGSGARASATTHHPERHGGLRAYSPLVHRHQVEMSGLLEPYAPQGLTGGIPVRFVPHSGPFARGIHATVVADLYEPTDAKRLREIYRDFYRESPFVDVVDAPPQLKHVVGTNRARLGVFVEEGAVVVTSVIDNLVKGAAGGAVQWFNRLEGLPVETGLGRTGLGWT